MLLKFFPLFPPIKLYFFGTGIPMSRPSETHPVYLAVKHAPLLTCLPVAPSRGAAPIAGATKECERGIKVIKVLFPAKHATCSWADFKSASGQRAALWLSKWAFLVCWNPPALRCFGFREICADSPGCKPLSSLHFPSWLFLPRGISELGSFGQFSLASRWSAQLALCLYFGFHYMLSLPTSNRICELHHSTLKIPRTPWTCSHSTKVWFEKNWFRKLGFDYFKSIVYSMEGYSQKVTAVYFGVHFFNCIM